MIRRLAVALAALALLAGCSTNTNDGQSTPHRGRHHPRPSRPRCRHPGAGARHRERGLYLRVPDGRQLPGHVPLFRRQAGSRVQGRVERDPQHRTGLHPRGHRIQTPNSDTPYSSVGADLRTEPLVLTVPPIEQDRYYSLQFVECIPTTSRTSAAAPPATGRKVPARRAGWKGEKPEGIDKMIHSETDWRRAVPHAVVRPDDIENVKKIQAGYKVQPLSAFLNQPPPTSAPASTSCRR